MHKVFIGTCSVKASAFKDCMGCVKMNNDDCNVNECPKYNGKKFKIVSFGFEQNHYSCALLYDEETQRLHNVYTSQMMDVYIFD